MLAGIFLCLVFAQGLHCTNAAANRKPRSPVETPIIYPGPVKNLNNKYGNDRETPLPVPDQCQGKTFCTIRPREYPQEKFNHIFKGHRQVAQTAWVPEDTVPNRQGEPSSDGCDTIVSYEPLYQVRSKEYGDWRTVVQSPEENFVQRVRLEECKNTKKKCFTIAGDLGIETFCKQKYNVWEVLVAVGNNGTERIKTELPVCCSCHYRLP